MKDIQKIVIALLASSTKHYKQVKAGHHNIWLLVGKIEGYLNTVRVLGKVCDLEESSYLPILRDLEDKLRPLLAEAKDDDESCETKVEMITLLTPEGVKQVKA